MKKTLLPLAFLCFVSGFGWAQVAQYDAYQDTLTSISDTIGKIRYICGLSYEAVGTYPVQFKPTLEAFRTYAEANEAAFTPIERVRLLDQLQVVYFQLGASVQSTEVVFEQLLIMKQYNDSSELARIYFDLACGDWIAGNYESAIDYQAMAIPFARVTPLKLSHSLANYGVFNEAAGNDSIALVYYKKALRIADSVNDARMQDYVSTAYFDYHLYNEQYDSAAYWLNRIEQIAYFPSPRHRMVLNMQRAEVLLGMKLPDSALVYLQMADSVASAMQSFAHIPEIMGDYSNYYFQKEEYELSRDYMQRSFEMRDSIQSSESKEHLNQMKTLYEVEKSEFEKELAQAEAVTMKQQRNTILMTTIGVALLLLTVLFSFFQRNQRLKLESQVFLKERELQQSRADVLAREIELKDKELANLAFTQSQKSTLITETIQEIKACTDGKNYALRSVLKGLQEKLENEQDWELFKLHFDKVHEGFFQNLGALSEQLTPKDIKFCAYMRMNLSSKEIATIMGVSYRTVEGIRLRVRKKLGLQTKDDLLKYLMAV